MQSEAKSVDAYLEEVPAERKEALTQLRDLCRSALTGFDESMAYGMPSYSRNGEVEVGFASQKNYISLYILKQEVMDAHKEALAGKGYFFVHSQTGSDGSDKEGWLGRASALGRVVSVITNQSGSISRSWRRC